MSINRREMPRSRVRQPANVVFNGRQTVLDCTVRNRSETGALVRMSDWIALPRTFELDIAEHEQCLRVRQCWRRGDDVGVVFMTAEECEPAEPVDLATFRAARPRTISEAF